MIKKIVSGFIGFIFSSTLLAQPGIQLPYCDNFDGQNLWTVISSPGTEWELGAPDTVLGFPLTVHSAPNVWGTGLNGPYQSNTNTYLVSPKFNFLTITNANLSFWYNSLTEPQWDGTRLEYSLDSVNWIVLGFVGDPLATNWYTNASLNCSSLPGWDGNSSVLAGNQNGWLRADYSLAGSVMILQPQVWFRFHFCSDFSIQYQGFAIDDFCLREPADIDAGIELIDSFNTPAVEGSCNNLNPVLKNYGALTLNQLTIKYSINGNAPVSYLWNGNLAPGSAVVVPIGCYTVPLDFHSVCIWTSAPGDTVTFNDTTCVEGLGIQIFNGNVCHDFEINNNEFFTLNFTGTNQWELGTPAYGVTTGAHSGVNAWDINLTTTYGVGDADTLYSAFYSVDSLLNPTLIFWHNRNTETANDGYWIEYAADYDTTWNHLGVLLDTTAINWYTTNAIPAIINPVWDGDSYGWQKSTYFLKYIAGIDSLIRFRFIFKANFGSMGVFDGVSIDDFCFFHPDPVDAAVEDFELTSDPTSVSGTTDTVIVRIRNYGNADLTATDIYFSVNGGTLFGPYHWTGLLQPTKVSGDIYLSNFPYTIPTGNFDICAWTNANNDNNASNDTSCSSFFGVTVVPLSYSNPYCNDFEGTISDWTAVDMTPTQNTLWELGMPSFGTTTGTYSGLNCWDINLTTAYQNSANTALYTPIFQIPSNSNPVLSFYHNENTELNWDGVHLEYSIDGGNSWTIIGGLNPLPSVATNWYNMFIQCSASPAWAGNSSGWLQSIYRDLAFLGGSSVRFRFVFCSDPGVILDGFSIDDFCLELAAPVSASPTSGQVVSPIPVNFAGQCYPISVNFTNTGLNVLFDVNATLIVDGVQISSGAATFSPGLSNGSTSPVFTFPNCWNATPGIHNICIISSNPNNGLDYNMFDDTLCFNILVMGEQDLTSGTNYCQDFESSPAFLAVHGLTFSNISTWKYGLPTKTFLNDANSGNKAWVTNLAGNYPANDNSALLTESFVLNSNTSYTVRFFNKFKTEYLNDGGTFQYSTDYGISWMTLGDNSSPQWMNSPNIVAINPTPPPNISGWSGNAGWHQVQHQVCFPSFQGTIPIHVVFRFLFMSDLFTQDEGWEIDDFCLEPDTGVCTVGLNENIFAAEKFSAGIYPNPAQEKLTLAFYVPADGVVDFMISDVTGKILIHSENVRYQKGMHQIDLSSYRLAPGSYFYSAKWENQTKNGKLVITGQ